MLKRKANFQSREFPDDSEENMINTTQEIHQRKIFRARRPVRSLSQNSPSKFKIQSQLVSLEQEERLLNIEKTPKTIGNIHHTRTRSENPFRFDNFLAYTVIEPLKEIIQNLNVADESKRLKRFLESNIEKNGEQVRFAVDCTAVIERKRESGMCKIVTCKEKGLVFLVFTNESNKATRKQITRECICKEIYNDLCSTLLITFLGDHENYDSVKLEMNPISKHLFLRCFSECKLQS